MTMRHAWLSFVAATCSMVWVGCGPTPPVQAPYVPHVPTSTTCPAGFVAVGDTCVAEVPPDDGLCAANQTCFELEDGAGVCGTTSGGIPLDSPSCTISDCGAGRLCITATGVEGDWCLETCDPDLGPKEPTPEFTAGSASGTLAIDDLGIRTYFYQGEEYYSTLSVSLRETGSSQSCSIVIDPAFVSFGRANTSTRTFATVTMDLGASTMLEDGCGWDDDHIFATLTGKTVTIGFTQARFEEDRPNLDIYHPESSTTVVGGGIGFLLNADGSVNESLYAEPVGGVFVPGVYQW